MTTFQNVALKIETNFKLQRCQSYKATKSIKKTKKVTDKR